MNEAWERAVVAALTDQAGGSAPPQEPRSLTLDGAVKCLHGRLPSPEILERYQSLERLSIANVGVSSLDNFPRLKNLQRLSLSDNRIAGGLEFLVEAGLDSLRDLDLSNNRIQFIEDLAPLARLRLVSLDLYECPVTRIRDYRARVFGMIRSIKYLDKLDVSGNERPESDDEDDDDEEEEDEEDEEDPGSGEVDGGDTSRKLVNGGGSGAEETGVFDEDEESDADEETYGVVRGAGNVGLHNGYGVAVVRVPGVDDVEVDEDDDGEEDEEDEVDLGEEEIDEDDGDDEDLVEVHDVGSSSEEDVDEVEVEGEEVDEDDDEDGDGEEDDEDVEDEEDGEAGSPRISTDGEIDGHEQGEGDEDENGEIGEEDAEGVELDGVEVEDDRYSEDGDGDDEDEDGAEFLVQPINRPVIANENGGSELEAGDDEDEEEDEVDDGGEDEDVVNGDKQDQPSTSHSNNKRKRDDDNLDDDSVEDLSSSKHH